MNISRTLTVNKDDNDLKAQIFHLYNFFMLLIEYLNKVRCDCSVTLGASTDCNVRVKIEFE